MLLALGLSPSFRLLRHENRVEDEAKTQLKPKTRELRQGLGELACHPRCFGTDTRNARGLECW